MGHPSPEIRISPSDYFAGLSAINWHVPVVNPGERTHAQPRMLGQANFLPQKPRQVVVWKDWRNWRAETVPAQRTAATIAVRIVFLIVLPPMIRTFPLQAQRTRDEYAGYLAGA